MAQVGVGALVREALLRQKAKMLMLQIIMKFQEALEVRRRLARAVFERSGSLLHTDSFGILLTQFKNRTENFHR